MRWMLAAYAAAVTPYAECLAGGLKPLVDLGHRLPRAARADLLHLYCQRAAAPVPALPAWVGEAEERVDLTLAAPSEPALAFLVLCYEAPPNLWALLTTVSRLAGPRGAVLVHVDAKAGRGVAEEVRSFADGLVGAPLWVWSEFSLRRGGVSFLLCLLRGFERLQDLGGEWDGSYTVLSDLCRIDNPL